MKTKNLLAALVVALLCIPLFAQENRDPETIIRCYTMEADEARRAANPGIGTLDDFEQWLAPMVRQYEAQAATQRAVQTIPVVFHIIHNNGSDNLSASAVSEQINQLNEDFRKFGFGFNTNPVGADSEIEWCAATIDPNGNAMAEPGINRVNRSSAGFTAPPYSQNYVENTLKPNTIWDPTQYCNVWVCQLSGGLLGYAQFPEAPTLGGIGTGNGGSSTDGVVVTYTSVGSNANPNPLGGVYAGGRTLTHELGHWLGLRHIWGDGSCNVDDYCDDTPRASGSTSGCPSNKNSCNDLSYGASSDPNDMVENYMDYSYDACMNIFTNDQKARMKVVLASSVRRASLTTSSKCGSGGTTDTEAPTTPANLTASNIAVTTATLSWNASSDNVGVTQYGVSLNGTLLGYVAGTSANLTGLTASTSYNASVVALDAAGNTSGAATTSFTTLADAGGSCVDGSLTLTINLDNYPEETSWTITSGGSTVASGGTYGSQPDGSTVTQNITLGDGSYTFTIFDAYGDGICCGYGNGSYSLVSGGTVIASGGAFTSSEASNFCVESSGPGPDTEAPSAPANVTASNITQTTADLSWTASTDNVGVVSYNIYIDAVFLGSTAGTSGTVTGLTASTTYLAEVTALDAAGNESSTGFTVFTTTGNVGGGSEELFAHYFESGWDGWIDGGSDCYRYSGSRSYEGTRSIRLRDNSGTASAMTLQNVDVAGFEMLEFDFFFYPRSMENGEDFWVRFNDGSGWVTVATYTRGVDFNNNAFYNATVMIDAADFNFNANTQFRIQCDASGNNDQIYIDAVVLTGINSGRTSGTYGVVEAVTEEENTPLQTVDDFARDALSIDHELTVYPNPATNDLTIKSIMENSVVQIFSVNGVLAKEVRISGTKGTIDISALEAGTYIIRATSNEGISTNKFIKQ